MTAQVLIVDDDPNIVASLTEALVEHGYLCTSAYGSTSALKAIAQCKPDIVLCDVRMPDGSGLELLQTIKKLVPGVDVILMTAYDDMSTIASAMRGGAADFLVKPIGFSQLLRIVGQVTQDQRFRRDGSRRTQSTVHESNDMLVGRDPRMIALYKLVGQAAGSTATVLIRGESGTGKELVARAIHQHSPSHKEPFVAVNCAALPSTLLESELFGHVRGAFTGAHETRRGRFAIAGSGTIFLDEIGDTSLDFQTRLLRVIQDGEFQPVGSERLEKTRARVVAATHQHLEQMIAKRTFREDLYYRLRVVEIIVPPLRERAEDIPALTDQMLQRAANATGSEKAIVSPEAMQTLLEHHWPGNVRELENCIKRAAVLAVGGVIRTHHLEFSRIPRADAASASATSSLETVEQEQVRRVLQTTGGHKGRAADILGVSRPRLRRLIEKYGLE